MRLAVVVLLMGCAIAAAAPPPTVDELVAAVRRRDYAAQNLAKAIGPSVGPALAPLLKDRDADVRVLAVYCLEAAGAPDTAPDAVAALGDPEASVRLDVSRVVQRHPEARVYPALFTAVRGLRADDPARTNAIFALGANPAARIVDVRDICVVVSGACAPALARLGDAGARAAWSHTLGASHDATRAAMMRELVDYLLVGDARWLLPSLAGVLDDKSPAIFLSESFGPGTSKVESLRVCDVAVNAIAKITGKNLGFTVDGVTNYTDAQLAAARAAAR
jgi:hypothetical protein